MNYDREIFWGVTIKWIMGFVSGLALGWLIFA